MKEPPCAVLKLRCGLSSLKLHAVSGDVSDLLAVGPHDDEGYSLGARVWLLGIPDADLAAFARDILKTLEGEQS